MKTENFKSIKQQVYAAETVINKSKFIAFACGVPDTTQANSFIAEISKKHYDATHNCYAYIFGDAQKFSDDGEPQGTAGMPILEAIKSRGLCNVAVVVTRYFGGVMLGAGGLVRAYMQAAASVLDAAEKTEFKMCKEVSFTVNYQQMNLINAMLHKYADKIRTEYDCEVKFTVLIENEKYSSFNDAFNESMQGKVQVELLGEVLSEF